MKLSKRSAALLAGLLCAAALLAYEAGGFAYTKRVETSLLAEPKPQAEAAHTLAYGRKVKVDEVKGAWLRVSEGDASGWVFAGNLSATQPVENKGLEGVPLQASDTTATAATIGKPPTLANEPLFASKTTASAAARPLTPAAAEYATRRNLTEARDDLDWLLTECQAFTPEEVDTFLQEKKKGEFQ